VLTTSRVGLAEAMASLQLVEVIATATAPTTNRARLDRIGVPVWIRRAIPATKIVMALGLLVGRRRPRITAAASAGMVAFYAGAVGFHRISGDPIILALPAAAFGAGAAGCLLGL
jgi:hypothetical protein